MISCYYKGREISHRSTAGQQTACRSRKAKHFLAPVQHLFFHIHRHVIADSKVRIHATCKHICQHAKWCSSAFHPGPETGMNIICIEWQYLGEEIIVD